MTVTIYSTSICASCNSLADWLHKNGITYTKKITDTDDAIMSEFMSLNDGMIGVPFTVITTDSGEQLKISGYDRKAFKNALNLQ
jgi:arsenate reductase-like glutaredoxin family protein